MLPPHLHDLKVPHPAVGIVTHLHCCCWEAFCIFAYCGFVGNPHTATLPTSTKLGARRVRLNAKQASPERTSVYFNVWGLIKRSDEHGETIRETKARFDFLHMGTVTRGLFGPNVMLINPTCEHLPNLECLCFCCLALGFPLTSPNAA